MTKLIEKTGDLFTSTAGALAHGVNTAGLMGAGIAVEFKHRYPEMYKVYRTMCKNGDLIPGYVMPWDAIDRDIYNIASQDRPGKFARLEWFESGLEFTIRLAEARGTSTLAVPRIGCGIGGLRWDDVRDIIEYYANNNLLDIEVWTL